MNQKLEKYVELVNKGLEVEVVWLRQILTLSAGALALLAGLGPDVPPDGPARLLLAATWASLGLGIIFGAAATYVEVDRARSSANAFGEQITRELSYQSTKKLISVPTNKLFLVCKPLMIASLIVAVVSLTGFSIVTTLAA